MHFLYYRMTKQKKIIGRLQSSSMNKLKSNFYLHIKFQNIFPSLGWNSFSRAFCMWLQCSLPPNLYWSSMWCSESLKSWLTNRPCSWNTVRRFKKMIIKDSIWPIMDGCQRAALYSHYEPRWMSINPENHSPSIISWRLVRTLHGWDAAFAHTLYLAVTSFNPRKDEQSELTWHLMRWGWGVPSGRQMDVMLWPGGEIWCLKFCFRTFWLQLKDAKLFSMTLFWKVMRLRTHSWTVALTACFVPSRMEKQM